MNLLIAVGVGMMAGAHIATWGMFKDSIHEGFTYRKYFRSVILGSVLGFSLAQLTSLDLFDAGNLLLLFGMTYAAERAAMEFYKGFLREEDQSKYFIPMQLHVFGRIVRRRRARWGVGLGVFVFVLALVLLVWRLPPVSMGFFGILLAVALGGLGGLVVACGGAWKDGPFEGFEWRKFFRSPVAAGMWAALLIPTTDRALFLALAGVGYSVATWETYKTFFFPTKPRGKFAGMPVLYPALKRWRLRFVPIYVAIWACVLGAFITTYTYLP
jgi:hypothetical protein